MLFFPRTQTHGQNVRLSAESHTQIFKFFLRKINQPAVIGEMLAGIVLGPCVFVL